MYVRFVCTNVRVSTFYCTSSSSHTVDLLTSISSSPWYIRSCLHCTLGCSVWGWSRMVTSARGRFQPQPSIFLPMCFDVDRDVYLEFWLDWLSYMLMHVLGLVMYVSTVFLLLFLALFSYLQRRFGLVFLSLLALKLRIGSFMIAIAHIAAWTLVPSWFSHMSDEILVLFGVM
jgi:hypothetical protein